MRAESSAAALFEFADAAIVAVPTVAHVDVVRAALARGLDVLVEKPIAASIADAEELLALAKSADRILQVGHLERFNSAMRRVAAQIRRPRFIEAHRLGPFPARATDVDVVRDLMIHDLDVIQGFLGEEPSRIEAIGVPVLTDKVDIANARLTFPSGCVANLTASRVYSDADAQAPFVPAGWLLSIDFLTQSVVIFRRLEDAQGQRRASRWKSSRSIRGCTARRATSVHRERALAECSAGIRGGCAVGAAHGVARDRGHAAARRPAMSGG